MTDWLPYVKEHVNTSYKEVQRISKDRGEFFQPIAPPPTPQIGMFSNRWVNFYELGATFYSAARLLDDFSLTGFMEEYRRNYEHVNQLAYWHTGNTHYIPDSSRGNRLVASAEYERLLFAFNQKRLNAERFITTNLRHAVELCLKALVAVTNEHLGKGRTFPWTHSLGVIYRELPEDLRNEIEAEVPKFAAAYIEQVKKVNAINKSLFFAPAHSRTLIELWDETRSLLNSVIADLNTGGYTVPSSNVAGWDVNVKAEHLIQALNDGPAFDEHRYGPKAGPDEYPTQWVLSALTASQFFYEHLFPVPFISQADDRSGPLSEMRGPPQ